MSRRAPAFTLLEMMAVVLLLGLVFLGMGAFFRNAVGPTTRAPSQNEATRRALLVLDRISRDLEGATLVEKPDEVDPLAHPWLFLADSRLARDGADRLKFDSRTAGSNAEHAGDVSVVAYWVEHGDADDLRLLRFTSPALPESLDRDFPNRSDESVQVVANGLARFGVKFDDEEGAVAASWDSSTLERSSKLPIAAEITLALRDPSAPDGERSFTRRVVLPIRPIDLAKALSGKQEGDDKQDDKDDSDQEGCVTVGECLDANSARVEAFLATQADPAGIRARLDAARGQCAESFLPALGYSTEECQ